MRDLRETENKIGMETQDIQLRKMWGLESVDSRQDGPLDHMQENPLGHLLKMLSTLPEIREEKVFRARTQIHQQEDQLDQQLDVALDRVLEELITES